MQPELVMIVLFLTIGAVVVYSLSMRFRKRELQHKERLSALDKGMPLPELSPEGRVWSPRVYLLRGMLWLFGGIAITVFLGAIAWSTNHTPSLEDRVWRARNLRSIGATEEEIKQEENDTTPTKDMPAAVSLLGLVPIGVGLAYLIYYRVESKHAVPPVSRPEIS